MNTALRHIAAEGPRDLINTTLQRQDVLIAELNATNESMRRQLAAWIDCASSLREALQGTSDRLRITLCHLSGQEPPRFLKQPPSIFDYIKANGAAITQYEKLSNEN